MEPITQPEIATEILVKLYGGRARSKDLVTFVTAKYRVSDPTVYLLLKELQERGLITKEEISSRNVQYELSEMGRVSVENKYIKMKDGLVNILQQIPERDIFLLDVLILDVEKKLKEKHISVSPDIDLRRVLLEVGEPLVVSMKTMLFEQVKRLVEERLLEHHSSSPP